MKSTQAARRKIYVRATMRVRYSRRAWQSSRSVTLVSTFIATHKTMHGEALRTVSRQRDATLLCACRSLFSPRTTAMAAATAEVEERALRYARRAMRGVQQMPSPATTS